MIFSGWNWSMHCGSPALLTLPHGVHQHDRDFHNPGPTMTNQPYDSDNVFAKILNGDLPAHKIYEDEATFAFMDIMPRGDGHCLVIPRKPARNLLDVDTDSLAAVVRTVQKVSRAAVKAFNADGLTVQQFNEPAGGQIVFHLHFHILPRFEGVKLRPHTGEMADQTVLAEQAEKIRAALE
jgi:histidine triad (HIT) family protein